MRIILVTTLNKEYTGIMYDSECHACNHLINENVHRKGDLLNAENVLQFFFFIMLINILQEIVTLPFIEQALKRVNMVGRV